MSRSTTASGRGRAVVAAAPPRTGTRSAFTRDEGRALGERIRQLRVSKGMTQAQVAGDRLTKAFISQVEIGKTRPSPESLQYIAARLGASLDELMNDGSIPRSVFLLRAAQAALAARDYEEVQRLLERVRGQLQEIRDLAVFHRLLGEAALARGELSTALTEGLEGVKLIAGVRDAEEALLANNLVGRVHAAAGRYPASLAYLDRAADHAADATVSPVLRARVHTNRGNTHMALGDVAQAVEAYEAARSASEDSEDLRQLALAHMGLGEAARERRDYGSAMSHAERAITLFERIELRQLEARILHNLGHIHADRGDREQARAYQERALAAARVMDDRQTVGHALERLAVLDIEDDDAMRALSEAHEAVATATAIRDNALLAVSKAAVAEACHAMHDDKHADEAFEEALRVAAVAGPRTVRAVLLRRGTVLRARGDIEGAASCFEGAALANV